MRVDFFCTFRQSAMILVLSGCSSSSHVDAESPVIPRDYRIPWEGSSDAAAGRYDDAEGPGANPDDGDFANLDGDAPPGSATIGGSVGSITFGGVTAYSTMRHPFTCRGFEGEYESQITITVSDQQTCEIVSLLPVDPCVFVADTRLLQIEVTAVRLSRALLGPGSYPIRSPVAEVPFASVALLLRDGSCNVAIHNATSGTVTLTSVNDSFVAGRVELAFSTGGNLSGEFVAPHCAAAQRGMAPDCEPSSTCSATPMCHALRDD
jgi:hypothetical protein